FHVTGVQTCALPIFQRAGLPSMAPLSTPPSKASVQAFAVGQVALDLVHGRADVLDRAAQCVLVDAEALRPVAHFVVLFQGNAAAILRAAVCGVVGHGGCSAWGSAEHRKRAVMAAWWLWVDSNHRPQHYECCALTG